MVQAIPNDSAWSWMVDQIPWFDCPDEQVLQTYYFRWWVLRKHLRQTPTGWVITEFLPPVSHAGPYNTISCALGHHLAEVRWLVDGRYGEDTLRFWLRGHQGGAQPHLRRYSQWLAAAVYEWYLVRGGMAQTAAWLPDLITDFEVWDREHRRPDGLYWQYDVRDGMEESISGSRTERHVRVPLNAYMYGNARALAALARWAGCEETAAAFDQRADQLQRLVLRRLWDASAGFFKTLRQDGTLADVRELAGYLPWRFGMVPAGCGYEVAWRQLIDSDGFWAPAGLTTAERRHPRFRSHGVGRCEWDGAVWPFATSQTLGALLRVLREGTTMPLTSEVFFDAFLTYTRSHRRGNQTWIGEYLDEVTGDWIHRGERSKDYNHSTYADLLITGVVGLIPREDSCVEVRPMIAEGVWDWFCLDGVPYRGRFLSIFWDRTGARYCRGPGFHLWVDGEVVARRDCLEVLIGPLP
ncbi:MAG: trehalase family glycosidase [Verrucomicrobiota bacterium]|nr:trehalase family glycosidase [Limisphaera sp.]MDW8381869.1 trehalase family glycosidase [Verrucomicrobiota bacterium]